MNSRADFSTYSLSRGAPSPAWVRLHVKLCSFRGLSSRLSQNKWRNGWDSFSAENPRRLQHATGMLPRAAFRIPDSPGSINGGTGGIRTHAPFRTNGFQDRLVMTTSIPLRICFARISAKKILPSTFVSVNNYFNFFSFFSFQMFEVPCFKYISAISISSGVVIFIFL